MLPKTAEYALRAVACLAQDRRGSSSADHLAAQTKVPRRYLNTVLQDLAEADLVGSRSDPGGGYHLMRDPEQSTILDVVNAVSPLERIRRCPLGLTSHTSLCPLHKELDRAYAATQEAFANVTMDELLKSTSTIVPLCEALPNHTRT